jgi:hypothetical protein
VYVNHLYRVLYLRHAKTASSSLFCHFGGCRSNSSDPAEQALRFELLQASISHVPFSSENVWFCTARTGKGRGG